MRCNIGDMVRTTKDIDTFGGRVFPVGTIGKIEIIGDFPSAYKINNGKDSYWYSADMFEAIDEKNYKSTNVYMGERHDPDKADAMINNLGDQIKVVYEWGYKDGNLDGQEYAYNKGYEDARRDFSNSVKKNEVCIGDEVVLSDSNETYKGVITNVTRGSEEDVYAYIDECGRFGVLRGDDIFNHLTGRKFPEIGDVLAELRREDVKEDENGQASK
jgi:hypothetical protein